MGTNDTKGYFLMRKDTPITYVEFTPSGDMISFSRKIRNKELAPLQDMYQGNWLNLWWKERSIPVEQDNIEQFLRGNGYSMPSEYLIKNLGLSLTDYYWIKPVESDLQWADVNLYDNDFKGNLLNWKKEPAETPDDDIPHYSPNGSLQGTIEKSWVINNGIRCLIKGNHSPLSSESINEVIACEIHKRQGYNNYAEYKLLEIAGKEYAFGCYSEQFTSQKAELVSAWALYTNEKKNNQTSPYAHFLKMCEKFGMDRNIIQADFDYRTLVDFIMSGHDRHMNNIALLRNAESLEFLGMSPVFDSGGSMFAGKVIPKNEKDLLDIDTNGFCKKESGLMALVENKNVIDLTKLPPAAYIKEMYGRDPKMHEKDINNIAHWYERKIDFCRDLQLGRNVFSRTYFTKPKTNPDIK